MTRLTEPSSFFSAFSLALRAAFKGLGDGLRPPLVWWSMVVALLAGGVWMLVFGVWHAEVWQAGKLASSWFFHGAAAAREAPGVGAAADSSWSSSASAAWGAVSQGLAWLAAVLIVLASFALLVMLTLQLLLELFLMPKVQRHCLARHYPSLPTGVPHSVRASLFTTFKLWSVLALGLVLWVVPVLGGMAFFALAAYVGVRSLVNDALDGLATEAERHTLVRQHRGALVGLGVLMALFLMVPLVGLLAPAVLAASVCHLFMPALVALRDRGQGERR